MRPRLESLSLRSAVILLVLLPVLSVFGLGGFLVLTTLEERLEARLQEDITLIARTLRVPLARSLEREPQHHSLYSALRSASEFGRVYGVYVYDAEGTLIARDEQFSARRTPALTQLDVDDQRTTSEYLLMGGREVYSYFTPLTDTTGQTIGMLQVTRRASEIRDYLDRLRVNVALVTLGFCAVFIIIIVFGHHLAIGRPLERLTRAMAQVAGGDTRARAAVSGPQEIRALAGRFNGMLDGIVHRDAVLSRERRHQMDLERQLRQSEKYALVGRLASGVAHELGAPLSVVDGHAQRLLRRKELLPEEQRMLTRIRESADRMAVIVRQLLGFGRDTAVARLDVPVQRVVGLAAADVRSQAEQQGVALEVVAGPRGHCIPADELRLREALVHLLRNALHAAAGGHVRIGWRRTATAIQIFVENSGQPIRKEDRDRIFEPFFTTKAAGEGSGLGLAIVKGTIADHGGDVAVCDSPLGGARFEIDLPLDRQAPERGHE